ncbi:helix-turn-helix domain-containing protein (plasmid) [Citricoccus nitrophenolicus]
MTVMAERVDADSPLIRAVTLSAVLLLAAASFTLSVPGIMAASEWAMIPEGIRWLVPVCIDATLVVYSLAAAVQYGRGESTRSSWLAVGFFTAVSVVCNASHVLTAGTGGPGVWFGAALAAIMPIGLFFATHTAISLVVEKPTGSAATRRRKATAKARALDPGAERSAVSRAATKPKQVAPDAGQVLQMRQEGKSVRQIAQELGTSSSTVQRIVSSSNAKVPAGV